MSRRQDVPGFGLFVQPVQVVFRVGNVPNVPLPGHIVILCNLTGSRYQGTRGAVKGLPQVFVLGERIALV